MQNELRGYMNKIKVRNEVVTKQEKLLSEKDQGMEKLKRDLESSSEKLKVGSCLICNNLK